MSPQHSKGMSTLAGAAAREIWSLLVHDREFKPDADFAADVSAIRIARIYADGCRRFTRGETDVSWRSSIPLLDDVFKNAAATGNAVLQCGPGGACPP